MGRDGFQSDVLVLKDLSHQVYSFVKNRNLDDQFEGFLNRSFVRRAKKIPHYNEKYVYDADENRFKGIKEIIIRTAFFDILKTSANISMVVVQNDYTHDCENSKQLYIRLPLFLFCHTK